MNDQKPKIGHPVLGILLGILGIVAALLLTFLTGIVGGGLAFLLGLAALLLGMKARNGKGRGIGAIAAGALAVVLAVLLTVGSVSSFRALYTEAVTTNTAPLVARYLDKPYLGLAGMILNAPSEADAREMIRQLDALRNYRDSRQAPASPLPDAGTPQPGQ